MTKATDRPAFDTNAIIYLVERVQRYEPWLRTIFLPVEAGRRRAVVSVVTEAEALVKPLRTGDRADLARMRAFFANPGVEVLDATRAIAAQAAKLRADLDVALADAMIIATALVAECDALVGNDARCAKRVTQIPYIYLDDVVKTA